MRKVFVKNGVVVSSIHVQDSALQIGVVSYQSNIPDATEVDVSDSNPVQDGWTQNADGSFSPPIDYVDDVPTFLMRIPPAARIAARASQDPLIVDFMSLLDDPRTRNVNRALTTVIQAVEYLTTLKLPDGTTPALTMEQAQAILNEP